MSIVQLENLGKRYGRKVEAVKEMNLEVKDKEFVVFLGPSGCGKTTTLRMIGGLEEVTRGTIFLDGRDITDATPKTRGVSMVFQSYAVWPHMTVYDNIAFALKLRNIPRPEIDQTVDDVSKMVKINELLTRYPSQLSGGQQQRVALARALAVKPKLFLMDEPLSNLDAKLRVIMRTELKAIHQQTQATTIFVTHDQSEAMSMADRIVIMKEGKIVQIGTPDDVYFESADVFVAGFIGTPPTNFFNVQVTQDGESVVLKHPKFCLPLDRDNSMCLKDYRKNGMILGVRPEDIKIVSEAESIVSAKVLVVEPQGSHQIISFKLEEDIVKFSASASLSIGPGDTVHLNFDNSRLHFFDVDTEKRITKKRS